jgi:hypothetical protein
LSILFSILCSKKEGRSTPLLPPLQKGILSREEAWRILLVSLLFYGETSYTRHSKNRSGYTQVSPPNSGIPM